MNPSHGYSEGAEVPEDKTPKNKTYNQAEWISVKDRLPENIGMCILAGVDKIIEGETFYFRTIGCLMEGTDARNNRIDYWIDWSGDSLVDDVTHWMPLPEPPK